MQKPISEDLRRRVIEYINIGKDYRSAAKNMRFHIHQYTVSIGVIKQPIPRQEAKAE